MKTVLLAIFLVGSSTMFGQISIGVNIGVPAQGYYVAPPPPPPPPVVRIPRSPGRGYVWVPGFYVNVGPRYRWNNGYWARPPYRGAVWVAPRYKGNRYYPGYWRR